MRSCGHSSTSKEENFFMFKFVLIISVLLVPVCVLLFGTRGCGNVFPQDAVYMETEDAEFLRGRELVSGGRDAEAMAVFQEIVRRYPNASPESNMEAGLIAFRRNNYPQAIYHFNQYLALSPEASSGLKKRCRDLIDSAKKQFFQEMLPMRDAGTESGTTAGISLELQQKYRNVMQQNEQLKLEIARLRAQLSAGTSATSVASAPARSLPDSDPVASEPSVSSAVAPPPEPLLPPVPATHTVVSGDTLSAISKKYYGTAGRWKDIYQANRVTMKNPSDLKIGMVLKLPRP